jgi:hypothetical protein
VREFANGEIRQCFQSSPEFMSAITLGEQYYHAQNLLNIKHHSAVPLSLIGRIFGMNKGTIKGQTKQYFTQESLPLITTQL